MAMLTAVQLAQRISALSRITILAAVSGKVRRRFVKRYGFWEPYEQDEHAVYYGMPVDDREIVRYASGGDYVIFAR